MPVLLNHILNLSSVILLKMLISILRMKGSINDADLEFEAICILVENIPISSILKVLIAITFISLQISFPWTVTS